jgi:hypothetical protein
VGGGDCDDLGESGAGRGAMDVGNKTAFVWLFIIAISLDRELPSTPLLGVIHSSPVHISFTHAPSGLSHFFLVFTSRSTPLAMPNFAYPTSPSSPRMLEERKWTVSPEFGDALLTAMRERTESGGPKPRLPSLLQLPTQDNTPTHPSKRAPGPESSSDNTKLTMKTRVAVRDKTPHRFQVVPLREIGSLSLPAQDATPLSKARRGGLSTAKLNLYGGNRSRVRHFLYYQPITHARIFRRLA